MSQNSNNKGKDNGKKYASYNLSQNFQNKGNKNTQGNRHGGMQLLGKVQGRRVLKPVNLSSLKRENLGNDPRVNLVPSGSGGWGQKEQPPNQQHQQTQDSAPITGAPKPTPVKAENQQEVSLRPNAGVVPSGKNPTDGGQKTWGSKANSAQSSDSPYFQKEFPTLGQDGEFMDSEKGGVEGGDRNANRQAMDPRMMNGQKWMENSSGVPNPFPGFPGYAFVPVPGGRGMAIPYPYFPYPGGKVPPFDPNLAQRMPRPGRPSPNNRGGKMERPLTVKDSDLRNLDQEKDDNGWAAAQDEVDYNAKLNFDESDSDDERPSKKHEKKQYREGSGKSKDKEQPNWPGGYPAFHQQMINWQARMQLPPGYEPPQGANPGQHGGYPFPYPYFMPPFGMPGNMQPGQEKSSEEGDKSGKPSDADAANKGADKANFKPLAEDEGALKRKAAAQAKLQALEQRLKDRKQDDMKVEDLDSKELPSSQAVKPRNETAHDTLIRPTIRSRNNSEASDSSRRSGKDLPPRFQRKRSTQSELQETEQEDKNAQMRIMGRKESSESQKSQSSVKETHQVTNKQNKDENVNKSDESKASASRQGNNENKNNRARAPPKGGLKDLSETRKDKEENMQKTNSEKVSKPASHRLTDMRTKGPKPAKDAFAEGENRNKESISSPKPSPWAKVNAEKTSKPVSGPTTSLVEIQKEEEEQAKHVGGKHMDNHRFSPDENKFRSDYVGRYHEDNQLNRPNNNQQGGPYERQRRPERGGDGRFDKSERRPRNDDRKYENKGPNDRPDRRNQQDARENRSDYEDRRNNRPDYQERREKRPDNQDRRNNRQDYQDKRDNRQDNQDRREGDRRDNRRDDQREHSERRTDERRDNSDKFGGRTRDDKRERKDDNRNESDRNNRRDRRGERSDRRGDSEIKRDNREDRRGPREPRDDRGPRKPRDDNRAIRDKSQPTGNVDGTPSNMKPTDSTKTKVDETAELSSTADTITTNQGKDQQKQISGSAHDNKRDERSDNRRNERRTGSRDIRETRDYRENRDNRRQGDRSDRNERKPSNRAEDISETSEMRKPRNDEPRNDWRSRERKEIPATQQQQPTSDSPPVKTNKEGNAPQIKEPAGNVPTNVKATESLPDTKGSSTTVEEVDGDKKQGETKKDASQTNNKNRNERSERRPRQDRGESRYDRGGDKDRGEFGGRGRGRGRRGSTDRFSRGAGGRDQAASWKHEGEGTDPTEHRTRDSSTGKQQKRPRNPVASTTNWEDTPPRFRQSGRGRGEGTRGARIGRGRGRGASYAERNERRETPTSERVDNEDVSKKDDNDSERYYSANEDEVTASSEEKDEKGRRSSSSSQTRGSEKRGSLAYKTGRTRGGGRGTSRGGRNVKEPFLGNRQQVREKQLQHKGGDDSILPAADKNHPASRASTTSSQQQGGNSNLEEISMHSPPKKVKPSSSATPHREEKKRDISRDFDLSNIAGVVIVDNIPSANVAAVKQAPEVFEDDGFTMVTSRKQLKEQRDRAREEEKKKLKIEQKKEAAALAVATNRQQKERQKARKDATNNSKEQLKQQSIETVTAASTPTATTTAVLKSPDEEKIIIATTTIQSTTPATVKSSEASTKPSTVTTPTVLSTTTTTSVSPIPASNAAMAAIGVWEPAQSLMRTSQPSTMEQVQSKPAVSSPPPTKTTNGNAWQRPLTLPTTSTVLSGVPDPRAVGTGKPSSLQTSSVKSSVVQSTQQSTPDSASPLFTPPTLTPIVSNQTGPNAHTPQPPKSSTTSVTTTTTSSSTGEPAATKTTSVSAKGEKTSTTSANVNKGSRKDTITDKRRSDKRETETGRNDGGNNSKRENAPNKKLSNRNIEKPPRFQNASRDQQQRKEVRESDVPRRGDGGRGTGKYEDKRRERNNNNDRDRQPRGTDREDNKSRKRNSDRQTKVNGTRSTTDTNTTAKPSTRGPRNDRINTDRQPKYADRKQQTHSSNSNTSGMENKKQVSASPTTGDDSVFVSSTESATVPLKNNASRSSLSDADKVVGSKKPSLKSQSSIGSYTETSSKTLVNEDSVEIKIQSESFQAPSSFLSQQERDERSAKQTARSVIKSLNDDEEKSLGTRSLPGTPPPLAVKIPQPTLAGPSSDPGRAPSPKSNKVQAPSIDREMNEMNRRLLNTRRVWESSYRSETQGSPSEAPSSSKQTEKKAAPMRENPIKPSSPSKASENEPATTNVDSSKAGDEKPTATSFNNIAKRPEQQVCKVKPQQQQPVAMGTQPGKVDVIRYTQASESSTDRNLGMGSPLSTLMMPRQGALYGNSESSAYATDTFRSTPNNNQFASLASGQVSHSAALSQQALSSLQVGNLYGSGMWQLMPTSSIQQQQSQAQQSSMPQQQQQQPTKNHITYPATPNHGSLFTSPSSLAGNTSLIMQYDSNFDQRNTNMQRQPISIVPMPQQQQSQQANGLIGMVPSSVAGRPGMRRDQHYRNVPSEQMAMLAGLTAQQQHHLLAQQQQAQHTDLTKHVNAKPFEPTTQASAPPLIASPPIMHQPPMHMQQQIMSTVFRPSTQSSQGTILPRQHHVQSLSNHHQQQQHQSLMQSQQRHSNIQTNQHAPLVASVMPRQALPMNMSGKQPSDRPGNFQQQQQQHYSKVNTNLHQQRHPNMAAMNVRRQPPMSHVQQLPMSTQSVPQNHLNLQQQQRNHQQRNVPAPVSAAMNFPNPIQRPSQMGQTQHINYSTLPQQQQLPPSSVQQQQPPALTDFKKIQRQKMLADTKKYFQQNQEKRHGGALPPSTAGGNDKEKPDEKPIHINGTSSENNLILEKTASQVQGNITKAPSAANVQQQNLKTEGPLVGDSESA